MTIEDIEKKLPNGFHDAGLMKIEIDFTKREAYLNLRVSVSDSRDIEEIEDLYKNGRLILKELLFFVIEAPDQNYISKKINELWISDSGPVQKLEIKSNLPTQLPEDIFVHYFFISDWNAFIFVAAKNAFFEWT